MEIKQRILGLIFVAGEQGVSLDQMSQLLDINPSEIEEALKDLTLLLRESKLSPVNLVTYNQHYKLVTKRKLKDDLESFAQAPFNQNLSQAAVETLAIIAYRQPITRLAVEEIRGVASANMIQKLIHKDLVKEIGRVSGPGRPFLYGVTDYFMDYFALESLEDLPEIEPLALNAELASEELFRTKEWQIELFEDSEEGDDLSHG